MAMSLAVKAGDEPAGVLRPVIAEAAADTAASPGSAPDSMAVAARADTVCVAEVLTAETCGAVLFPAERLRQAARPDTSAYTQFRLPRARGKRPSIYELPYSLTTSSPDWHRLWINAAIFTGAYLGTLTVLEILPEDATNWNRASIRNTPWYKRWSQNIIDKGPEWDGDDPIFNYILHPYAGAVYFMAARSNGFNFYQSLLFCACVSTIGWEFGIEGCMERPSIQDIFITPLVGSVLGEGFYIAKRYLASHDYRILGSRFLGGLAAFIMDPVNEVVGLFAGNPARRLSSSATSLSSSLTPDFACGGVRLSLTYTF